MGGCLSHIIDGSSSTHEYDCVPCCGEYDPSPRRRSKFKGKQKKRRVMEILAAEARSNDILYRTVGRMCSNGSTSNACVFTQQGRKGINQESASITWNNSKMPRMSSTEDERINKTKKMIEIFRWTL